jgi:hypothetical protein
MQTDRDTPGRGDLPRGLPKPAQRALAAAGYTSLAQLARVSETDLRRLHGWARTPSKNCDGLSPRGV